MLGLQKILYQIRDQTTSRFPNWHGMHAMHVHRRACPCCDNIYGRNLFFAYGIFPIYMHMLSFFFNLLPRTDMMTCPFLFQPSPVLYSIHHDFLLHAISPATVYQYSGQPLTIPFIYLLISVSNYKKKKKIVKILREIEFPTAKSITL